MQLQPPRVESDRAELLLGDLPTELTKPIRFGASVCPACRHRCKLGQNLRAGGRCNRELIEFLIQGVGVPTSAGCAIIQNWTAATDGRVRLRVVLLNRITTLVSVSFETSELQMEAVVEKNVCPKCDGVGLLAREEYAPHRSGLDAYRVGSNRPSLLQEARFLSNKTHCRTATS